MPERELQDAFTPFRRGEASHNRETGGAGLGLSIAQAVAEHHGGRVCLPNREGAGLRAEFVLPEQPASTNLGHTADAAKYSCRSVTTPPTGRCRLRWSTREAV